MNIKNIIEDGVIDGKSLIVKIKPVSKIPKYATDDGYTLKQLENHEEIITIEGVHFIVREYKKHKQNIFVYGYYLRRNNGTKD